MTIITRAISFLSRYNVVTMNYGFFADQVRKALARFHDRAYLQAHPLARLLLPSPFDGREGMRLQRLLLDTIEELKPQTVGLHDIPEWRRYRSIYLRYVEGLTHEQTVRELKISHRQGHRDHHEALEALVSLLWSSYQHQQGGRDDEEAGEIEPESTEPATENLLDAELVKLARTDGRGPVSLLEVLDAVLATVAGLATIRHAQIRLEVEPNLPPVAINKDALRQVLLGVLSFVLQSGAGDDVEFRVASDGAVVQLLLTRTVSERGLHRTYAQATHDPEDGRLRLSIRLLEMFGGSMELAQTSAEGLGLIVRLRLPAVKYTIILIVDDSPDFCQLIERFLHGYAYNVLRAYDAEQALRLAREGRPQVVILDVLMPSQDGWEILRQLRRLEQTREIPIVICSVISDWALAQSLGATHFLPKPVTQRALLSVLDQCQVMSAGNRGRPADSEPTPPR